MTTVPYGYVRKMLDVCGGEIVGFAFNKDELPDEKIAGTTEDIAVYVNPQNANV